ncbi:hypothetical protein HFO56_39600 [Rhizobium laguerreae]|uniref:hypothetical protein n=1 Tax=Rhizobium laguerreae TaxID=1076926 RepID=UPI001C8FE48E|nr:hypothetical protein [Rhizobium laguerreae]MBY3158407.1 hypothetical protein [Rhizobium laguerreae]
MLRAGDAKSHMSVEDLQRICPEPELHEYDDIADLEAAWEEAKAAFSASER